MDFSIVELLRSFNLFMHMENLQVSLLKRLLSFSNTFHL